jgi:hypothetical protein
MDILLLRVLHRYPSVLSQHIGDYILRSDWRTCRLHEATLIRDWNGWTKRVLDDDALDWYDPRIKMEFPIVFSQKELDVYLNEWTLFGRWYLILRTKRDNAWYLSRNAPLSTEYNWYACAFDDLHNYWRKKCR